jgi:glucokinase
MAAQKRWIGFDLGGTKMMCEVFDEDFRSKVCLRKKTKASEGEDACIPRIVELIEEILAQADTKREDLLGIGIGSPGPLDLEKGVLLDLPNFGWRNVPLKKKLEEKFGCSVIVANDCDAGTYGEYRFGAGKNARCVLGVFPGTGIGAGCVLDGKLIRGKNHSCMEIGHMRVLPSGPLCGCGRKGCLEAVASRLAVAAAAATAAHRGEAPGLLKEAGMDISNIKSGDLAAAVKAGDKVVESIVRDAAKWIGVAVGNVVNLLAPEVVVLGGGMVEAMPELIRGEVEKAANKSVMPSFEETFKVTLSQLGDEAVALGAAAWAECVLAKKG